MMEPMDEFTDWENAQYEAVVEMFLRLNPPRPRYPKPEKTPLGVLVEKPYYQRFKSKKRYRK